VKALLALFHVAFGLWLGGFLAVATAVGGPAAVALGAFGLLSTFSAAVTRIGSQQSDQIVNAAEPTLSRATGSAATSNHTSRR
jgi:hypothetical protein